MVLKRPVGFCYFAIFLSVCLRHSQVLTQRTKFSLKQPSLVQANSTTSSNPAWEQPSLDRGNGTALTTYAWSAWGSWSPCSRSCGGGVSVQERQCLPRDPSRRRSRKRRKMLSRPLSNSIRQARSAAHLGVPDCPGLARRYHECNTAPCAGLARDSRAEQCAVYDRRPFRGRFYTWVPYVDGNSPCTLNCRPRGQQFYASLALVADGTPCTKPGFRAICVQGNCLAVGREGVLASTAMQDVRCGSKMVSGLFTRQKLPLGYTFVTTIPMGACRLNITESQPSANYIVLKVTNGSFIINGDFALSAPGTYDALGARFIYSMNEKLASVLAAGPIHHPVDVMMLYTAGNTNLRYEYLTESEKSYIRNSVTDNKINNNIFDVNYPPHPPLRHHRHQNAEYSKALERMNTRDVTTSKQSIESNTRNFVWKILSYTPCSRTCGSGLQIGKYKCVEVTNGKDREVSPAYCKDSAPAPRRRRCGGAPCPTRWRAAVWGPCPVCGPANRTRTVGCVRSHARGITKIADDKCSPPKPPTTEACNIPACDKPPVSMSPRLDHRRQVRPVDRTDNFRNGPVYTLKASPTENEISPTLSPSYSFSAAGGWLYTEWSECVGWCDEGVRSRGVRCADPSGCSPHRAPAATQPCKPTHCEAQWFTSEWSPCSGPCGGRQIRGVVCMGGNSRRRDIACRLPKPETERACGGTCSPSWYLSDWGECKGPCEAGVQTRTVWCARGGVEGASGAARDIECPGTRPLARKSCVPSRCTTKPLIAPTVIRPSVSDSQPRVQRQESNSISQQISNTIDKPVSDGRCTDQLSHCALAVQARLCHYPYYSQNCCHSCHG